MGATSRPQFGVIALARPLSLPGHSVSRAGFRLGHDEAAAPDTVCSRNLSLVERQVTPSEPEQLPAAQPGQGIVDKYYPVLLRNWSGVLVDTSHRQNVKSGIRPQAAEATTPRHVQHHQ